MKRIFIIALFLVYVVFASAQAKKIVQAQSTEPAGKSISITLSPLKNCWIYLGSYYGKGKALVDSAYLDNNSKGIFKGPNKLTGGIYFVVSPKMTILFELIMDKEQHFNIVADTTQKDKVVITGSLENELFKTYSSFSNTRGKELQELEKAYQAATTTADSNRLRNQIIAGDKAMQEYREAMIKKYPNSFMAVLFNTMKRPTAPLVPIVNNIPDSLYPFRFVKNHFWDDVNFNDDRILRTPFFETKLDFYYKFYVSPEPDSIINEVKYMLLMARTGKEIYPYLLTKFTNKYINPEFMGQDKVFVYLFENFYAKGDTSLLNPTSRKTIIDRAYSLMANQIGQAAPALDLTDSTGKINSLYSIQAPFTVVAFWDPNCGHCKKEIPRLDSMYKAKWKALGVAVYSVNIVETELTAWKKFIKENQLKNWVHVYQTKEASMAIERAGKPGYKQLYDVSKTPTLYLLDKDKHIIAKQLSIEQFDDLIKTKLAIKK